MMSTIGQLRDGAVIKAGAVPGFYARRRGNRTVWLMRYSVGKVQRELIFGCLSEVGYLGNLAGVLALEGLGRKIDFEAALLASKGAREPIPPQYAELVARRLRTMIEAGRDLVAELRQRRAEAEVEERERGDRSVEAVADRWVKHLKRQGKRTADEAGNVLRRHVHPRIGAKDIGKVGRADAHRIYDALAEEGKVPSGAQAVRLLRALLSYAADRSLIPGNPLLRIKVGANKSRSRILIRFHPDREPDATELRQIWAATETLALVRAACIKVLILTAQRRGEVAGMRWGELDGGLWRIPPERHKGARGHQIPLSPPALAIIDSLQPDVAHPERLVFAGRGGHQLGSWSTIKAQLDRASGVRGWVLHDLRRSAATWMREVGFSRDDVDDVLGHALPQLVGTYQRGPAYARKRAALEAWASFVYGAEADNVVPIRA